MARQYSPFQLVTFLRGFLAPNGNDLNQNMALFFGAESGITATAGGAKAGAYQLTKPFSVVETVASDGDSVLLPDSSGMSLGQEVIVANADAAQDIRVFGHGSDTIDGVATATGNLQGESTCAIYKLGKRSAAGVGSWYTVLGAA